MDKFLAPVDKFLAPVDNRSKGARSWKPWPMSSSHREIFDPSHLRLGRTLREDGIVPGQSAGLVRVRRGVWLEQAEWDSLTPNDRHRALVHATAMQCPDDQALVFSHAAAAALLGLPRIDAWPTTVDALVPDRRIRGSALIRKHIGAPSTTAQVEGLWVTAPARTVIDLARTTTLASGLAAADHALRVGLCTPDELAAEVATVPPYAQGGRRSRLVVALADARAESALESMSRAHMFQLNLPRPELQRRYVDAEGFIGHVDFDWDGRIGEADGKGKYRIPDDASPRDASEILWREKQREDRLRRCSAGFVRWDWAVGAHPNRLAARLAEIGVRPQRRNTWLEDAAA